PRQKQEHLPVGPEIEKIFRRDLTGHDRIRHPGISKTTDQFSELTDTHPFDPIDHPGEAIVSFIREGGGNDALYPGATSGLSKKPRINTVAGNDAKCIQSNHPSGAAGA